MTPGSSGVRSAKACYIAEQRPGWSAVLSLIASDLFAFFKPSGNNPGQDYYYEERRSKKVNKSLQ